MNTTARKAALFTAAAMAVCSLTLSAIAEEKLQEAESIVSYESPNDASAELPVILTAVPDRAECFVGDEFTVTISAVNSGDCDIEDLVILFEDTPVRTEEKLAPGEKTEFSIKLKAWESDIASGGIINISAQADGFSAPLTVSINVRVKPAPENPDTGSGTAALPVFVLSGLAAAFAGRKRRG